jgi:short-subunit dehydrogenase
VLALHVRAGSALYSATKAWVFSFTRGLQEEFADSSVRIQAVLPAATATEIWSHSGVTVNDLPEGSVMTTDNMVDARWRAGSGRADHHPADARPACGNATRRRVWSCLTVRAPAFRHRAI